MGMWIVDSMGMQSVVGGHERSCLIGSSMSYLFLQGPRWTDGGQSDTEGKKDEVKERRQKCTRDIFVQCAQTR